jgi:hypothetical protein
MVPRPKDKRAEGDGARDAEARKREAIAKALDPRSAAAPGLVEGSNSDAFVAKPSARKGLRGLSAAGASKIEDLCSVVRQDRGLYGIWTVTLPPEAAEMLDQVDNGAQKFGDAIRRRFAEALGRACASEAARVRVPVPAHWWFVVEPQKAGRPHWHFVFRCKSRRGRGWLLGKGRLDRLIRAAIRTATGREVRTTAAGNVQALRSNPGRYLSKYLRKTATASAADCVLANGWSLNLVPFQWWGCSTSARELLNRYRFELPSYVVGWLSNQWPLLNAMGRIKARIWEPDAAGAPTIVVGSWLTVENLLAAVDHLVHLAERAYPSGRTYGVT